ncbi:MAG: hypothetical protein JRH16_19860, partial [Deltaproteobacteria bacterium]|nr:hypothetical protein [Deltaproteobacteria bacterium]
MSRHTAVLLSLTLVLIAGAEPPVDDAGWQVNGIRVPDEPWRAHDGPFLALLFISEDAKALRDSWGTKPGKVPLEPTTHAAPGVAAETAVFFVRCQPDSEGNCDVWGTASIVARDGRILVNRKKVPLWVGRPPPPGEAIGISEHGVGLVTENFAGSYTFYMIVT